MINLDLDRWHKIVDEYGRQLTSLLSRGDEPFKRIAERIQERLREHRRHSQVSLAFIGQYSAGKSTMISALTRNADIPIAAGITTDHCTTYEWPEAGIRLVDTPGLYAGRDDHDRLTQDEIERSDLLAFCITAALFDHITLAEFKELAVTRRYWPKMLLIVNKIYTESGNAERRINGYRTNLAAMLQSALPNSVPIAFVDAKMYLDGMQIGNNRWIERSRFAEFIDILNKLARDRDLLARADTSIRIVLSGVNDAILGNSGGDHTDMAFLMLINRHLAALAASRKALRREFKNAANDAARVILEEGEDLMAALDGSGQEQFLAVESRSHHMLERRLKDIHASLETRILAVGAALQAEVQEIQSLPLFDQFVRRLSRDAVIEQATGRLAQGPRLERQAGILQNIAAGLSGFLLLPGKAIAKGSAQAPAAYASVAPGAALDAAVSAGNTSTTGHAIASGHAAAPGHGGLTDAGVLGHLDGVLVNTVDHLNATLHTQMSAEPMIHAAHVTNHFLQTVGPFLAFGSAAISAWSMYQEYQATEMLGNLRLELQEKFEQAREQERMHLEAQGAALDTTVLVPLEREILARRAAAEAEIGSTSDLVQELRELRARLEASLGELIALA
jgi:hypothetical protein